MKTCPYQNGDHLIELVEKREYDALSLLAHELATLRAEDMATINDLRQQLQDTVKRMEEVPIHDLKVAFREAGTKYNFQCDAIEAVRARLILAVKGDQP